MTYDPLQFERDPSEDLAGLLAPNPEDLFRAPSPFDNVNHDVAPPSHADTIRRVQSASSIPYGMKDMQFSSNTGPLPIRPTRRTSPEDISSLESSQSLLQGHQIGSYTDDSANRHFLASSTGAYHGNNNSFLHGGGGDGPALAGRTFNFAPASAPAAATRIPAPGGHWAWIPASDDTQAPPLPPVMSPAPGPPMMVPINSGPLPLPVPVMTGALTLPQPMKTDGLPSGLNDLDIDFLDSFDIMEMADSLGRSTLDSMDTQPMPMSMSKRAVGSCPLPTLLEDALSAEDDGSDDTMHGIGTLRTDSPPVPEIGGIERSYSGAISTARGSRGPHHHAAPVGMPIPGARSAPLKLYRNQRSASQPHLSLLASSLPSSSDRPIRSAARRSLAVTAAALQDTLDDSDSELSEGGLPVYHGSGGARRTTSTRTTLNGAIMPKKKHNPWTLEETLALVEGVRLAGVGKWAEIKRLPVPGIADVLESRTPVDLKDKWRNLTRVARLPKAALRQRLQRSPSDVPLETMLTVKQLMEANHADGE